MLGTLSLILLARFYVFYSASVLLFSAGAYLADERSLAFRFFLTALLPSAFSILILVRKLSISKDVEATSLLAGYILLWISLSILSAIPFYGFHDVAWQFGIFESVANLTTTGSQINSAEIQDKPIEIIALFWRSWLHVIGAVVTLMGLVSAITTSKSFPRVSTITQKSAFTSVVKAKDISNRFVFILITCLVACAAGWCFSVVNGTPVINALILSVSSVTTGQVASVSNLNDLPVTVVIFCAALMFMSSTSWLFYTTSTRAFRHVVRDPETLIFGVVVTVLVVLQFLVLAPANWAKVVAVSVSLASTSGLFIDEITKNQVGLPVVIFFGLIGGSAVSTTSGFKIYRLLSLFERATYEFNRLAGQNLVVKRDADPSRKHDFSLMNIWVYLTSVLISILILAGYLSFLGLSFQESLVTSVGTFSNSIALFSTDLSLMDLDAISSLVVCSGMLLGRLELFILIALFFRSE